MGGLDAHFQASVVHKGDARTALRRPRTMCSAMRSLQLVDFSFGIEQENWRRSCSSRTPSMSVRSLYRYVGVRRRSAESAGGIVYSVVTTRPRTIGLKFSQAF